MKQISTGSLNSVLSIAPPRVDLPCEKASLMDKKKPYLPNKDHKLSLPFWVGSYFPQQLASGQSVFKQAEKFYGQEASFQRIYPKSEGARKIQVYDGDFEKMKIQLKIEKTTDKRYLRDILVAALPIAVKIVSKEICTIRKSNIDNIDLKTEKSQKIVDLEEKIQVLTEFKDYIQNARRIRVLDQGFNQDRLRDLQELSTPAISPAKDTSSKVQRIPDPDQDFKQNLLSKLQEPTAHSENEMDVSAQGASPGAPTFSRKRETSQG